MGNTGPMGLTGQLFRIEKFTSHAMHLAYAYPHGISDLLQRHDQAFTHAHAGAGGLLPPPADQRQAADQHDHGQQRQVQEGVKRHSAPRSRDPQGQPSTLDSRGDVRRWASSRARWQLHSDTPTAAPPAAGPLRAEQVV